ncbi:MAG: CBS domain-containing protein [Chloroflexi bacterium]|nr:CBS domain-containing protein [Chloroflexota bacterium]MBV9545752.1 CBS domain-containing protein [Chloroflexota bacterium]
MKVGEIMTRNVISVPEDAPVREVARVLDSHRISGVPVTDGDGHMVGLISEYDLIAKPDAHSVGDAMTRDVISVMEDTGVEEVRYLLVQRRIKRVPVLRGQKLVGIVSRADLVREIALTWLCQVCGHSERGTEPPGECQKCGTPSGFEPQHHPPVGEGAEIEAAIHRRKCPSCGQEIFA